GLFAEQQLWSPEAAKELGIVHDRVLYGGKCARRREKEAMAANAVIDRWSLSGRTALVTGGTKGIGYVSHARTHAY
ncbi:hypothetical protein BHE74_00040820, partial [Ensete ventricosum]